MSTGKRCKTCEAFGTPDFNTTELSFYYSLQNNSCEIIKFSPIFVTI